MVIKVVSVQQMRDIEAASGISYDLLMENAGRAAAERALSVIGGMTDPRVTVLVGPGNNGGDGLVAGRILAQEGGAQVRFYLLKRRADDDAQFAAVRDAGLFVALAEDDQQYRVLRNMVASADMVIDALFGVGVSLPLRDNAAKVLRNVQQALNERRAEHTQAKSVLPASPNPAYADHLPYVLAIDCPSGLNCDTGELDKHALYADETVTFIAAKTGLLVSPGLRAVGKLSVATLGVPEQLPGLRDENTLLVTGEAAKALLPERPLDGHKGTFGRVLIAAGSVNYTGAAALAAQAAYRAGAGLVTVGAPHPVVGMLAAQQLEPTWLLLPHDMGVLAESAAPLIRAEFDRYSALLLGPGWGREDTTRDMLNALLDKAPEARRKRTIGFRANHGEAHKDGPFSSGEFPPLVIDADGLNALADIPDWWTRLPANTVLTPHPGEMARLMRVDSEDVQVNRIELARNKASEWGVIVLLKGAHTVIAAPDGAAAVLPFKTDALAKAGTGDVLAGTIAGLMAQGVKPFDAALLGGYIHGLAGQLAAERLGTARSVLAGDVVAALAEALATLEAL